MPNLCGVDQKLMAETLHQLRTEKSQSIMTNKGGGGGGGCMTTGKIKNPILFWTTDCTRILAQMDTSSQLLYHNAEKEGVDWMQAD